MGKELSKPKGPPTLDRNVLEFLKKTLKRHLVVSILCVMLSNRTRNPEILITSCVVVHPPQHLPDLGD